MDTGEGHFVELPAEEKLVIPLKKEYCNHGGTFTVGEEFELKGSLFRVKSIKPSELRLKLLRRNVKKKILTKSRPYYIIS